MSLLNTVVMGWLIVLNVATFLAFAGDKWRAGRSGQRIAERTLLGLGALGGWPGGWLAMRCFRHKTAKVSFRVKYYLAFLPFGAGLWVWWRFGGNG